MKKATFKLLQFWPIRFFRESISYLLIYLPFRLVMPLTLPSSGYSRSSIGTCTILAPPEQMQIILEGIAYLQTLDPKIFLRLSSERRYIFWYCKKTSYIQCGNIFAITDDFMSYGKEGVVVCFVQCVLHFNLVHLRNSQIKNLKASAEISCEIQKQVFEFVERHSFSPELVKHYQKFAEDAEREFRQI